jgi:hypothetical protein
VRRIALVALAAGVCAGCGHRAAARSAAPVPARDWHAVVNDVLMHGRLGQTHSCAAVVVARAAASTAPPALKVALNRAEGRVCRRGDATRIAAGMSDTDVVRVAGAPVPWLSGPHCWVYRAVRRVCFSGGRVTRVQEVVHG